jgi:hypothetical protein
VSVLWPLQVALVERWKVEPGVTALVSERIYDGLAAPWWRADPPPYVDVPETKVVFGETLYLWPVVYPYIRIGSKTEVEASAFAERGSNSTLTWDVFSRPLETTGVASDAEAYAVYTAANASALGEPFAINGYGDVGLRLDFSASLTEDNGATRHINVRYRFSAMETA